jgi:hypothetical protein
MSLLQWLLLPMFLHVALILVVGVKSLQSRIRAARAGGVKLKDIANNSGAWPEHVRKLGNNFDNQFEVPMLWYAVTALVVALSATDTIFVVLSWAFFVSRVAHSYIQTGENYVPHRMFAFLAGMALVTLMWIWFAIRLFGGSVA